MTVLGPLLAIGLLAASSPGGVRPGEACPAPSPASLARWIDAATLLEDGEPAQRPDPGPEDPPAFQRGYRPDAWTAWETPDPLRRAFLSLRVGVGFYYQDSIALEMDNPSLYLTGSEETAYRALWAANAFHGTLEAGLAVTPSLSLALQASYISFSPEVSPPPIHVTYVDANNFERILSANDLNLLQVFVAGRVALPLNQVSTDPTNLWKWREPADASGFIPFLTLGGGVAMIDRCWVSVQRMSGGSGSTVRRALFLRTINPALGGAIGLEYRFSFLSFDARVEGAYNGKPGSGWPPYTDAAQPVLTYHLLLSARLCF